MAITVGPTYNDATGEYGEQQVSYTMHHGSNVPVALEEAQDEAYAPFEPDKYSNDAAFGDNPTEAELNAFWASDRPITPDEISIIQDHIQKLGFDSDEGRRLGRFLNYRVTGNSDELYDDDKLALNIKPPDPNAWTNEERSNSSSTYPKRESSRPCSIHQRQTSVRQQSCCDHGPALCCSVLDGSYEQPTSVCRSLQSGCHMHSSTPHLSS